MSVKSSLKTRDLLGHYFIKQNFKTFYILSVIWIVTLHITFADFFIFLCFYIFSYFLFSLKISKYLFTSLTFLFSINSLDWPVTMEIVCHHQICCRSSELSFSFCWLKLLFYEIIIHFSNLLMCLPVLFYISLRFPEILF